MNQKREADFNVVCSYMLFLELSKGGFEPPSSFAGCSTIELLRKAP